MVDTHLRARGIHDERLLSAMARVPRHEFVEPRYRDQAYADHPLPIGAGQTVSQPYIVALMLQVLRVDSSSKVLEVGTGTGYQAVVLSKLAAKVFSIERVRELAQRAMDLIKTLKITNITVKIFDGTFGWSDQAPFDRIVIAAAAPEVPQPLVQQLARTGIMVLPIGSGDRQRLARVRRVGTGVQIEDCGTAEFVPLVGRYGWKE